MSRCFYRKLEANNITFLPEGLFDNLINLKLLWVYNSLFSLSNKLKIFSPKEPRDQREVIRRAQGFKTSNSEEKCPVPFIRSFRNFSLHTLTVQVSCTFKKRRIFLYSLTSQERENRSFNWQTAAVTVNTVSFLLEWRKYPFFK